MSYNIIGRSEYAIDMQRVIQSPEPVAISRPSGNLPSVPWSIFLSVAALVFVLPTMFDVAHDSWSNEQGAHGPIVLVTGLWLLLRELHGSGRLAKLGSPLISFLLIVPLLIVFVLARISSIIEIEAFTMYGAVISAAYCFFGRKILKRVWFPLIYLMFMFPPPNTLFDMVTQPLKIAVSESAVSILGYFGYAIAGSGVTIQIGQYQMLVAAACSGMNSLLSLTSLGLFYTYIRHSSNWPYMLFLVIFIVPIAFISNLVRVLLLLLITYHFGEAAGQGFFHEAAGITMFAMALLSIFSIDWLGTLLRRRLTKAELQS